MKKFLLWVGLGIIALIGAIAIWLYTGHFTEIKAKIFRRIDLPVALVGHHFISAHEYFKRLDLTAALTPPGAAAPNADTHNQILNQVTDATKLRTIAGQYHITASVADINDEYQAIVTQANNGDAAAFAKMLSNSYHMSVDEFKQQIIVPDVLQSNLALWYDQQQNLNADAYKRRDEAKAKIDGGLSFDDAVKQYSDDEATKQFAGDTGFVIASDLLPELRTSIAQAKPGDVIEVTSRFGLYILKLLEVDTTGSEPRYHLQELLISETGFDSWYNAAAGHIRTRQLIKF